VAIFDTLCCYRVEIVLTVLYDGSVVSICVGFQQIEVSTDHLNWNVSIPLCIYDKLY